MSQNEIRGENVVDPTVMSFISGDRVWCMTTGTSTHWVEYEVLEGTVSIALAHLQWGPNGVLKLKIYFRSY